MFNPKKVFKFNAIGKIITKDTFFTTLLLLILMVPNFFVLIYFKSIQESSMLSFSYILLSLLCWLFPLLFLKKKIYFYIGLFFLLLSPLEIVFVKNLGTPITYGFIDSVFNTNRNEASEQILSNINLGVFFIILLSIYIWGLFKIKNSYLNIKFRILASTIFVGFHVVLFIKMYQIQQGEQQSILDKINYALMTTFSKYKKVYPADLIINSRIAYQNRKKTNDLKSKIKNFKFNAKSNNQNTEEEIYVLVIGETARYHNFHLNGYKRETSPKLDKRKKLLSFSNVYSCANITLSSVPQIITRATPTNIDRQYTEKTIVDAFKEAGFNTSWFANQNNSYPVIQNLIQSVDYYNTSYTEVDINGLLDENILPQFTLRTEEKAKKKFIVIHTLGSHFRYTNRYSEKFKKFLPVMNDTGYDNMGIEHKEKIVNSYDNSILYTDYFLDLLINQLEKRKTKAVLLFLSDHGENLYDDEREYFGHGTLTPTQYEYHIPYFIWYSDEYESKHPTKIQTLKNNLNHPHSSSTTFYTLLDLANITYPLSKINHNSIASKNYKIPNKRYMLNSQGEVIEIK